MALLTWAMGLPLPGDEGGKYAPEGYLVKEVGPTGLRKGVESVNRVRGVRLGEQSISN